MVGLLDETINDKNQRKQEEADNLPVLYIAEQ